MILLDTHVALWLLMDPKALPVKAREAVAQARSDGEKIACSVISFYEIGYLAHRNRLRLNCPIAEFLLAVQGKLEIAGLTAEIAACAAQLARPFPGDPIDRMIAATAIVENCTLITADQRIAASGVCKTLW